MTHVLVVLWLEVLQQFPNWGFKDHQGALSGVLYKIKDNIISLLHYLNVFCGRWRGVEWNANKVIFLSFYFRSSFEDFSRSHLHVDFIHQHIVFQLHNRGGLNIINKILFRSALRLLSLLGTLCNLILFFFFDFILCNFRHNSFLPPK